MRILAIETSCDETASTILSVDETDLRGATFVVESHLVHSQTEHALYGGVFPNVAKREHAATLVPLLRQVLRSSNHEHSRSQQADFTLNSYLEREPDLAQSLEQYLGSIEQPDIDYICVTTGPGLAPALWVGVNFARTLAATWGIPLVPVNHMEGHIVSVIATTDRFIVPTPNFPALALLVSGGHTELVLAHHWGEYEKIGWTQDDAAGEAFDKVARLLGLPYPGGPKISQLASQATGEHDVRLPRPMLHSGDYHFSFSGLKTAVRRIVEETPQEQQITSWKADVARGFESAVVEVLTTKTARALEAYGANSLILAGGVAANTALRNAMTDLAQKYNVHLSLPDLALTGDNSLMIAVAGYFKIKRLARVHTPLPPLDTIRADGNWSIADA